MPGYQRTALSRQPGEDTEHPAVPDKPTGRAAGAGRPELTARD